jgi:hypothetical protein
MAIETPPHSLSAPDMAERPSPARDEARETIVLDPVAVPARDCLAALDHRSRGRTVPLAQAGPGHYLGFADGSGELHLLALDRSIMHIGRAGCADVRLEDARVSRRHAIVVRYGDHVRVLDDRSSGGTHVNGLSVVATDLQDGDIVRLGPVLFTYIRVR